jgi:hypothetical protein
LTASSLYAMIERADGDTDRWGTYYYYHLRAFDGEILHTWHLHSQYGPEDYDGVRHLCFEARRRGLKVIQYPSGERADKARKQYGWARKHNDQADEMWEEFKANGGEDVQAASRESCGHD